MKLRKLGKNTSAEVTHISPHGIWILVGHQEYLLSFEDYPWFAEAKVSQIHHLELLHGSHLRWPDLDVDIDLLALENPDAYPLVFADSQNPAPHGVPRQQTKTASASRPIRI